MDAVKEKILGVELFISSSLRWGVIISSAVIMVGLVTLYFSGRTGFDNAGIGSLPHLLAYSAQPPFPISIGEVFRGLLTLSPYAVIDLGLLLLIATPVFRVAASVVAFLVERDRAYTAITTFVLAVLVLSFVIGRAE